MSDEYLTFADIIQRQVTWARWWLMASYLYYHRSVSLFRDEDFDKLSLLMKTTPGWEAGLHAGTIDAGMLETGSGFGLKLEDYPRRCVAAADSLVERHALPIL